MSQVIDKELCSGCYACANICPKQCIQMNKDEEGFFYPQIDMKRCIHCGLCKTVCPEVNEVLTNEPIRYVKARHYNKEKQWKSASGGAFQGLAETILSESGSVFAARFKDLIVIHDKVENTDALKLFIGSKYVQSDIKDTYSRIKDILEKDETVLFCGTPCQNAGLKRYLSISKTDERNLYTCEIICHGVGNPSFFKKYIEYVENKRKDKVQNLNFRAKDIQGWTPATLTIDFKNKRRYKTLLHNDPYGIAFSKGYIIRPRCFSCKWANIDRVADLTLGDFWGCLPKDYDYHGVSVISINTQKGLELLERQSQLRIEGAEKSVVLKGNPRLSSSIKKPIERDEFMQDYKQLSFKRMIEQYDLRGNWKSKVMEKVPYKLRKLMGKV